MSITFTAIDVECEQADQSFFVPQIRMTTKSTTQNAIMHGWREFIASTPPKTYLKATMSGVAERIGFTPEFTPRMCAGAMYTWSGVGEYDVKGVLISSYSKKFFAQCSKQFWPIVPNIQLNSFTEQPCVGGGLNCRFVGYCWPPDSRSCTTCDPDLLNWPLIGEQATNVLALDLATEFRHHPNDVAVTPTSYSVVSSFAAFVAIETPNHTFGGGALTYTVTVGSAQYTAHDVPVTDPVLDFPTEIIEGFEGAYINWIDSSNYSAVLSREYTDAEALANAQIITGTGSTASTMPRTTGYVSVFTSVVFTILASNLIVGKDYLVTVDLWEQGPGVNTHTPKQYGFTADATTHSIVDVIPTPPNFHTITVRTPTIAFV